MTYPTRDCSTGQHPRLSGAKHTLEEKFHPFTWPLAYMSGSLNPINLTPVGHEGAALVQGLRSVREVLISTPANRGISMTVWGDSRLLSWKVHS